MEISFHIKTRLRWESGNIMRTETKTLSLEDQFFFTARGYNDSHLLHSAVKCATIFTWMEEDFWMLDDPVLWDMSP